MTGRRFDGRGPARHPGAAPQCGDVEGHSRATCQRVGDSYEVYVNGVRQEPGRDFDRSATSSSSAASLAQEGRLGPIRWLSMLLGVAGTYRKHETVDLVYEVGGRRTVATLVPKSSSPS